MHYTIISAWSKICNAANYILSLAVHFCQLRWIVFMLIGNCILEFTWTEPFETSVYSFLTNQMNQTLTSNWLRITAKRCESGLKLILTLTSEFALFCKTCTCVETERIIKMKMFCVISVQKYLLMSTLCWMWLFHLDRLTQINTSIRPYCTSLLISAYVICACNMKFREDGYSRLSSSKQCLSRKAMRLLRLWREWPQSYVWRHNGKNSALWLFMFFLAGSHLKQWSCNVNAYLLTISNVLLIGRTFRDGEKRTGGVWFNLPSRWTLKQMLTYSSFRVRCYFSNVVYQGPNQTNQDSIKAWLKHEEPNSTRQQQEVINQTLAPARLNTACNRTKDPAEIPWVTKL